MDAKKPLKFKYIFKDELERIAKRRKQVEGLAPGEPEKDAVGLAFSGGGIRSATFNLGLSQALERYGVLKRTDYLSTSSGGGYVGASISWFMSRLGEPYPFGTSRKNHGGKPGDILRWFRQFGNYLAPGNGLTIFSFLGSIMWGTFVNLVIMVPPFFLLLYLFSLPVADPVMLFENCFGEASGGARDVAHKTPLAWFLPIGIHVLVGFLLIGVVYAIISSTRLGRFYAPRRRMAVFNGWMLVLGLVLLVMGSVPLVHSHSAEIISRLYSAISGTGILALITGSRGRTTENENSGIRALLFPVGLTLALYGILLALFDLALILYFDFSNPWIYITLAVLVSALLGFLAHINRVSMHRYYRDRLLNTYMPHQFSRHQTENGQTGEEVTQEDANHCRLMDLKQTAAPYHLINANLVTVGSKQPKLKARLGDNFLFSPLYCGAESTGYAPTERYFDGNMDLATAFSISGAAVNPNTGNTNSRPLAFLMALLNFRLAYWTPHPETIFKPLRKISRHWYWLMIREMWGIGLSETGWYLNLTDGGHFENTALYELLRRKCKFIVASDATTDPKWLFTDLANAIQKARVDFGIAIRMDTRPLVPDPETGRSTTPFVVGEIDYGKGSDGKTRMGTLIYIKSTMIDKLPQDLYHYRKEHPSFPDESIADQFFDEVQFEAYRELGFQIGRRVFTQSDDKVDKKSRSWQAIWGGDGLLKGCGDGEKKD